jgi:hypothetical protein
VCRHAQRATLMASVELHIPPSGQRRDTHLRSVRLTDRGVHG